MTDEKRIIRVFPKKTSFTPTDEYCFFGEPPFPAFIPAHDEVHVVVVFTWDIERGRNLKAAWEEATDKPVKIGGPAFDDPCTEEFVPGRYIKSGVTFTSRGCSNNCPFCFVPKREGQLRELPDFVPGNIIQDNNFLACSKEHRAKVYEMLKTQKAISFRGGLEAARLTDWDIEQMRNLRIADLWFACDSRARVKPFLATMERLRKAGFNRNKVRCYVLIGDDWEENVNRLETVFLAGALPFAQLFQPPERIEYSQEWRDLARTFSRPAGTKAYMRDKGLWRKEDDI